MKIGLLALLFISFTVQAKVNFKTFKPFGGVTSGGGYVIVCDEDKSIELLDFFEASQTIRGYALRDLPAGNDVYQKAHAVIDRIQGFSKNFNQEWHKTLEEFKSGDMTFIDRGVITDINDGRTVVSPSRKCYKVQAGLQVKTPGPYQFRVMIDKDLWNKMNDFTKVGLLVHEVIYKTALAQGHEDSDKVRLINSFLFSKYTETFKAFDYLEIFQFAKVDGCFESELQFNSEYNGTKTFPFSYKIGTFKRSDKDFSGMSCEKEFSQKFLDEGELYLDEGMIIQKNQTKREEDQICFSNQGVIFERNENQFSDKVCFLMTARDSHLIFSKNSTLYPVFESHPLITYSNCGNQEIDSYMITGCHEFNSSITLQSQELGITEFFPGNSQEFFTFRHGATMGLGHYPDTSQIRLNPHFQTDIKNREVTVYSTNTTLIFLDSIKGCWINSTDKIHFSLVDGKFKKVTRPNGELEEQSCAKYFSEQTIPGNSK